eukprot:16117340-Heterocapsa_arctica.AAC.1
MVRRPLHPPADRYSGPALAVPWYVAKERGRRQRVCTQTCRPPRASFSRQCEGAAVERVEVEADGLPTVVGCG